MRSMRGCLLASGLLLAGTALAQERGEVYRQAMGFVERIDKTVPTAKGGTLYLTTPRGDIRVNAWEKDEVEVKVVKKADALTESSARKLLDRAQIFVEASDKDVRVRAPRSPRIARKEPPRSSASVNPVSMASAIVIAPALKPRAKKFTSAWPVAGSSKAGKPVWFGFAGPLAASEASGV